MLFQAMYFSKRRQFRNILIIKLLYINMTHYDVLTWYFR